MTHKTSRLAAFALALAAALGLGTIWANGGAVEIFRGNQGPYELVVGVLPEEPAVGTVHLSVTPLDALSSRIVTDAEILVVANDPEGDPTYQARALNTPASPQVYETNITFESPGAWTLLVTVENQALGQTTFTIPLAIAPPAIPSGRSGTYVFVGIMVVLIAGGLWVWHSGRRQRRGQGT